MSKGKILTYDNNLEECMYRLPHETTNEFFKRLDTLRKKRQEIMTAEDMQILKNLQKGIAPPIVEDDEDDEDDDDAYRTCEDEQC